MADREVILAAKLFVDGWEKLVQMLEIIGWLQAYYSDEDPPNG